MILAMLLATLAASPQPGWLGFGFTYHTDKGQHWLFVRRVAEGGPAARAGIEPEDVITAIDGRPLAFKDDLAALAFFQKITAGRKLTLTVIRRQKTRSVAVVAATATDDAARWKRNLDLARASAQP